MTVIVTTDLISSFADQIVALNNSSQRLPQKEKIEAILRELCEPFRVAIDDLIMANYPGVTRMITPIADCEIFEVAGGWSLSPTKVSAESLPSSGMVMAFAQKAPPEGWELVTDELPAEGFILCEKL